MSKAILLRWVGNTLLILGYQIMLWGDFKYGLLIKLVGGILTIPFVIKLKMWDALALCVFFSVNEIAKLGSLFDLTP